MHQTVDLEATIRKAEKIYIKGKNPYTKAFVAKEMEMKWRSIQYWCTGRPIPLAKNEKLIKLFRRNNIEPVWRNK